MKFALHFGNFAFPDPEGARRLVRLAEAAGFDSVFAVEHVVVPDDYTSVYPYAPGGRLPGGPSVNFPDPLIWLTWVAAATTRLRFMTAVMILPQRNPLVLAKEVATLDYLSDGRIEPLRLEVPADRRFKIVLRNDGQSPIEFESLELRKEKVVGPGVTTFLVIRRLDAGEYAFFDDFHPLMPQAKIIAE